jgi:hypothetical protein
MAAAVSLKQPWRIFECICSQETARRRLQADAEGRAHPADNRDFQLYLEVKARFEAITRAKVVIDTDQDLESCVRTGIGALRG